MSLQLLWLSEVVIIGLGAIYLEVRKIRILLELQKGEDK